MENASTLRERVEAAVRKGKEVRREIAAAVAAAARGGKAVAHGFTDVLEATVAGAGRAVDEALPADREGLLRQVLDGVGDGLSMAAHAAELAAREVGGDAVRSAREEAAQLGDAFRDAPRVFVTAVREAAVRAGGHAAGAAGTLADHAGATLRRIEPSLAKAADALSQPLQLGRETLAAGAAIARGGTSAFLEALGRKLQALGEAAAQKRDRDGKR